MNSTYQSSNHLGAEQQPELPPRPGQDANMSGALSSTYEQQPELPPRPLSRNTAAPNNVGQASQFGATSLGNFPPPPKRASDANLSYSSEDSTYLRDPHRLTGYLIPFPMPTLKKSLSNHESGQSIPQRFLIYTPPAPPLQAPAEGEKEAKAHKLQRKWQEEVRQAKTNPQKVTSWKGIKGRATKGINHAINMTTSSNLDFLNRIPGMSNGSDSDRHADDGHEEGDETHRTVGLEEIALLYPSSVPGTPEQIRQEFLDNMLRSKTKAQKDSMIASGLLPVAAAIDILATPIWPFGGLLEIDGVWAYSSIRGAKTARSVTKRLNSSGVETSNSEAQLRLDFTPTPRMEILYRYLAAECHKREPKHFESVGMQPTETEVLEAIGWAPSLVGGEKKNWEDEQWEMQEVKEDFASMMKKGAKEWDKWIKEFEKDPEKASKK